MIEIASFEAKTHFSELLRRVARQGEKFVVTMRGKPIAVLGPVKPTKPSSQDLETLLQGLDAFRAKIAARGPVLKPGETWKEFAREGLD